MNQRNHQELSFVGGIASSVFAHVSLVILTIILLQRAAADQIPPEQIFSVTIEGGQQLGGISQAPKEGAKKILTPDAGDEDDHPTKHDPKTDDSHTKSAKTEPVTPEKKDIKLESPSAVDDPEKILAARKAEAEKVQKKAEAERLDKEHKKAEDQAKQKKKEEEEKEKKAEEKRKDDDKRKADEEKQREAAEEKKKEKDKEDRDKRLAQTVQRLKQRYEGESANAGGKGFGAAALGGKGMGGGILASAEKIAYDNLLQRHVKEGWRWLGSSDSLRAQVRVKILPSGELQDVRIARSSGNGNFDDSVVRAVYKASPVPPPPAQFAQDYSDVVFTFDSKD